MSGRVGHDVGRLARGCLMASFDGPVAPTWLLDEIAAGLGAVALFAANVESDDQVAELVRTLRSASPDVVVAIDEEGGDVTRLDASTGSPTPGNAALGAVDDLAATAATYRVIGRRLAALDIDVDLAPCADVNVAAANPVIGVRSFGSDAALVGAAVDGLQSVGVAACLKHFPGHGATVDDSHLALPVITDDVAELRTRELVPFACTRAAAVMTAHIVVSVVDDVPATRSSRVLGMLRDGLEYGGAIVSDALDMAGVHGSGLRPADVTPQMIAKAAVASLMAGCDVLCLGARQGADVPAAVVHAIVGAVRSGELPLERVAAAAHAAAALRLTSTARREPLAEATDCALMATVARRAVSGAAPAPVRGALVVDCRPPISIANFDVAWGLAADMAELDPTVIGFDATEHTPAPNVVDAAGDRPLVVAVRSAAAHPWQREFVEAIATARPDVVVVELGWPDDARPATLSTWGASRGSTRAVAELLVTG